LQKALKLNPESSIIKKSLEYFEEFSYKKIDGLLEVTVRDSNENLLVHIKSIDISVLDIELTDKFIEQNFEKETIFKNKIEKDVLKYKVEFSPDRLSTYSFTGLFLEDNPLMIIGAHHNQFPIAKGDTVTIVLTLFDLPE